MFETPAVSSESVTVNGPALTGADRDAMIQLEAQ
jgi:hypothetical protein